MIPLFLSINLWEKITAGWFVPGSVLEVEGQAIPSLTTCIQPLINWINPYVDAIINEQKHYLNYW